jgi:hypothetical protein
MGWIPLPMGSGILAEIRRRGGRIEGSIPRVNALEATST